MTPVLGTHHHPLDYLPTYLTLGPYSIDRWVGSLVTRERKEKGLIDDLDSAQGR